MQDAVGVLGAPVEILCRCLPSQDLVRHCPLLPPPLGGHFETVCRGSKVGGGERGPKPGARAPHLCQLLHSLAWGHLPRMRLPPPPPHIVFFTSPTTLLILKTAEGCSSPPPPFGQEMPSFWSPCSPSKEGLWSSYECPGASAQDLCRFNPTQ